VGLCKPQPLLCTGDRDGTNGRGAEEVRQWEIETGKKQIHPKHVLYVYRYHARVRRDVTDIYYT